MNRKNIYVIVSTENPLNGEMYKIYDATTLVVEAKRIDFGCINTFVQNEVGRRNKDALRDTGNSKYGAIIEAIKNFPKHERAEFLECLINEVRG